MTNALEETKPSLDPNGDGTYHTHTLKGWKDCFDAWWEARDIAQLLTMYLSDHHRGRIDSNAGGMISSTGWKEFS
jgi:hypothetical protein